VILYDLVTGKETKKCEKHTGEISALAFRKDGLWFASGAKDNVVYLWDTTNLARPTNKISFSDPIVQVNYNPCFLIVNFP